MAELTVLSSHFGDVAVSEELIDRVGVEAIDAAIGQLRLSGGRCWACHTTIHHVGDVSLVVHETSVGGKLGFIHFRCGPPQLLDNRRNRRAAIAMGRFMKERSTDAQAFVAARSHPSPHGILVVSLEASFAARVNNGDLMNPWLDLSVQSGFVPIAPDVFDAVPDLVEGWSLRVEGATLVCDSPRGALFDGNLEMPESWLKAIASERRCVVFVAGLGVDSTHLGTGSEPALNLLASKGLIAGGTVEVRGLLGIHAALGMATAFAQARELDRLLRGAQLP